MIFRCQGKVKKTEAQSREEIKAEKKVHSVARKKRETSMGVGGGGGGVNVWASKEKRCSIWN